ncbi:MAG: outer membrane lipoprotein-sorting protein [Alphaproteobacteria bacterium CG11_big_fil_rev_8_21_14_0_20_44_7]|nr:MAG: outer membrane lipoprotein-sorting protein [Alphaproteobacteria bacterium CG11_big_fil_rev_8_21_14_0_20_44_7]
MNKLKIALISVFLSCGFVNAAMAYKSLSAQDVLAMEGQYTPEQIGLAIMQEADNRDLGYGDFEVDVEMNLYNSHGESSNRKMRNKTFEVQDISIGDKSLIIFDEPRDVSGTAFLTHSKILEPDDQWLYLPSLKRVKRIASKNKSGPFVGSEFAYEDISSQEVAKFTYKYLGSQPCPVPDYATMNCFVIERVPAYEYSGYTKQHLWLDHDEMRPIRIDFYDRKDSLLKTLTYHGYQQYLGRYWRADKFYMISHQTGKKTELFWKNYKFRTGLKEEDLIESKLKQAK